VIDVMFGQLRAIQQAGQMPAHLDARAEVTSLLAIIRYHLDRLLPASRPENAPGNFPRGARCCGC
jgi:hypothetical protein